MWNTNLRCVEDIYLIRSSFSQNGGRLGGYIWMGHYQIYGEILDENLLCGPFAVHGSE